MRFPAHFNITLDAADKADLATARQAFITSMSGLNEEQQATRAKVVASGIRGEPDPYTRALANQVVEGAKARADVFRLQRELKAVEEDLRAGGYRPKDPNWRGAALERQEEIKREIELAHVRLIGIAEDDLATAQRKAAVHFREARQKTAKDAALKDAIARVEQRLEAEAVELQAETIAKGRRLAAGRPVRNAGDSQ